MWGYEEFGIAGVPVEISKGLVILAGFGRLKWTWMAGVQLETEVEQDTST